MHSTFNIGDPSKIPATLTITAPVGDFVALKKILDSYKSDEWHAWPLSGFMSTIEELIHKVNQGFYSIQMPEKPSRESDNT